MSEFKGKAGRGGASDPLLHEGLGAPLTIITLAIGMLWLWL
jgi:hypothetical protein